MKDEPTILHPKDVYTFYKENKLFCDIFFSFDSIEKIDELIKKMYIESSWPDHLKLNESLGDRDATWHLEEKEI